jgi:AbrB family looped-hinge helix DNA binding protein
MAHTEHVVSIGPQGRIVVPARFRRELGLAEGSTLAITSDGHRLILEPREEVLRRARGRYARVRGRRLSDELIDERAEEARRESAG